jgi:hypothetical protein
MKGEIMLVLLLIAGIEWATILIHWLGGLR